MCVNVLLSSLIKATSMECRSLWNIEIHQIYTPRFTIPEYEEIILISPLDELLLMGNYLNTIDGTLVHNSAAAHNIERDRLRQK